MNMWWDVWGYWIIYFLLGKTGRKKGIMTLLFWLPNDAKHAIWPHAPDLIIFILEQKWALSPATWGESEPLNKRELRNGVPLQTCVRTARIQTVASKSHNRRSCLHQREWYEYLWGLFFPSNGAAVCGFCSLAFVYPLSCCRLLKGWAFSRDL